MNYEKPIMKVQATVMIYGQATIPLIKYDFWLLYGHW